MGQSLKIYHFLLSTVFLLLSTSSYSQRIDTISRGESIIYNESFKDKGVKMDSINKKNNRVISFLIKTLYSPIKEEERPTQYDEFSKFDNLPIDSIIFIREGVGGDAKRKNKIEQFGVNLANALHATTKQKTIERNLILKEGDKFNSEILGLTEYLLRETDYFTDVKITPVLYTDSTVALIINTLDKLTLGASLHYVNETDSEISIYDNNFLGRGNTLRISEYSNVAQAKPFVGAGIEHTFNNLFGTFAKFRTEFIYGQERHKIDIELDRNFILPGDYAVGAGFKNQRLYENYNIIDTKYFVHRQEGYLWGGKSFNVSDRHNTPYFTMGFNKYHFFDEPGSDEFTNPYFHDRSLFLGAIGIYRERFYRTNMIYGFGYTEDIPYGYKVELTGGYQWGEFNDYNYIGSSFSFGNKSLLGYFNISTETGMFFQGGDNYYRFVNDSKLLYFTNLIPLKRNYSLRLFYKVNYLTGTNMLTGEHERVDFGGNYRIRGISIDDGFASTRFYNSFESVLFTPLQILNFRFAIFGFSDIGTLGNDTNPFKNSCFATAGIGFRVRNDNLIFNTIEFKLSAIIRNDTPASNRWVQIGSPSKVTVNRFIPNKPKISNYE